MTTLPDPVRRDLDVHEHWEQLVTVALLGTDRRDPPETGGPIADLVADALRPSAAERLLDEVAALTAVRRAAFLPLEPLAPLSVPADDGRPVCSGPAADRWRHVVASWPVLEDEWMLTLIEHGWRVEPAIVPSMLMRHRRDPVRWTRAVVGAGPLAMWLVGQLPALDLATGRAVGSRGNAGVERESLAESMATLPVLPIPPELAVLLDAPGGDVGAVLREGLVDGLLGTAHRNVLVNLLARVRADGLGDIAAALNDLDGTIAPHELTAGLVDLARTRATMLTELDRPADEQVDGAVDGGGPIDDR